MACREVVSVAGVSWLYGIWRTRSETSRARFVAPSVPVAAAVDEFAPISSPSVPQTPTTSTVAATSTSTIEKPSSARVLAEGRTYA